MQLLQNPQLDLAFEYVNNTHAHIFLTGKAGTGKTTFLQRIRAECIKRMAVVAPTGVAAINAGGMTIHSLFQLPFGPYLPGNRSDAARQRRFSGDKIRLIRSLDLLVIDEISMVRADLLDGIDDVLRRYRDYAKPFGGVQLLMIGDLHQLSPVAKEEEWALLRPHYDTPYFFSSQALRQAQPVVIELKHIYRQSDSTFIDLLNKVRDRQIDAAVLETLNSRYIPHFKPDENEAYITLSTHNATAQDINISRLASTPGSAYLFNAQISGDFPPHTYPTEEMLCLKLGAQVMFVKNDSAREKRYYNGKIGKVTRIDKDTVYVQCPGEQETITVTPVVWENIKYTLNEQTKEVAEEVVGSFVQYPLKLAWAITIHKSQGLTFERVILDAQAAFAHGQVYVALSRCKSFEGIVLHSPITLSSIRTDTTVKHYSDEAAKNAPDETHLERSKAAFQQSLTLELFGFAELKKCLDQLHRILLEHEKSFHATAVQLFRAFETQTQALFPVSTSFQAQLHAFYQTGAMPETDEAVQERMHKAAAWFSEKIGADLLPASSDIRIVSDNKELRKTATEALEALQKALFVKHTCLTAAQKGFNALEYQRLKTNAELDFKAARPETQETATAAQAPQDLPHPVLFATLKKWREETAEALNVELFQVAATKTLIEIVHHLPGTLGALGAIKGIGKAKLAQFGADLLGMVQAYCAEHNIKAMDVELPEGAKILAKQDTKLVSYELFRAGNTIDEVAAARGFVRTTIEGHLTHFVESGELDVSELMAAEDVEKIAAFFTEKPAALSSEAYAHFEQAYSYGQIKLVMASLKKEQLGV
jgi:hypothetical protein